MNKKKILILSIIILLLILSSLLFYYTFRYVGKKHQKYRKYIFNMSNQYGSNDVYE